MTDTFLAGSIEHMIRHRKQGLSERVSQMEASELDDPERLREIEATATCAECHLKLNEAKTDVVEFGSALQVTVRIPYEGSNASLAYTPAGNVPLDSKPAHRISQSPQEVIMVGSFPASTPPKEIKEWRAEAAKELQRWVQMGNADLRNHNDEVPGTLAALVEQRRAKLTTLGTLKDELGDGI